MVGIRYKNLFTWWLALTILTLPSYLIRFKLLIPTTLLEINIYLLSLIFIITNFRNLKAIIRDLWDRVKNWRWVIILFLLAATISIFVSNDTRSALGLFKAYFIDALIAFAWLVLLIRQREDYKKILGAMGISVVILTIIAALQRLGLIVSAKPWIDETIPRVSAVFDYPNALGLYVAPVAALFIGLILNAKLKAGEYWFSLVVAAAGISGSVLALSRGAILGIIGASLVAGLLSRYKKPTLLLGGLLILSVFVIAPLRSEVVSVLDRKDVSTDARMIIWSNTTQMIKDNWFFGSGLGGFPGLFDKDYRPANFFEPVLYPHNIIMNFWVELGLLGLMAFIWLEGLFLKQAKVLIASGGSRAALAKGLIAFMVALIIHGLVDVPYFKNDLAILFWVIMGMLVSLANTEPKEV